MTKPTQRRFNFIQKAILTLGLLALATLTVKADVAVYNLTTTVNEVGQGITRSYTEAGWAVIDVDSGDSYNVRYRTINGVKSFRVEHLVLDILRLRGPGGTTLSSFSYLSRGFDTFGHLVTVAVSGLGQNSALKIKTTRTIQFPSTANTTSVSTFANASNDRIYGTVNGALSFHSGATLAANAPNKSILDEVNRQRAYLVSKGYPEY